MACFVGGVLSVGDRSVWNRLLKGSYIEFPNFKNYVAVFLYMWVFFFLDQVLISHKTDKFQIMFVF